MRSKEEKERFEEYNDMIKEYIVSFRSLGDELPNSVNCSPVMHLVCESFMYNLVEDHQTIIGRLNKRVKEIEADIKFRKTSDGFRPVHLEDYIKDSNNRVINAGNLFKLWDKCLDIYGHYLEYSENDSLKSNMNWFKDKYNLRCIGEIMQYINFTKRLIDAAHLADGSFYRQAAVPFTKGKKRI